MKPIYLLFFIFSLVLFVKSSDGRKEPAGDYWKIIMKDQSMPEAIKNLIPQNKFKFARDFDVGANAIIYHSRDHNNPNKLHVKEFKPKQKAEKE